MSDKLYTSHVSLRHDEGGKEYLDQWNRSATTEGSSCLVITINAKSLTDLSAALPKAVQEAEARLEAARKVSEQSDSLIKVPATVTGVEQSGDATGLVMRMSEAAAQQVKAMDSVAVVKPSKESAELDKIIDSLAGCMNWGQASVTDKYLARMLIKVIGLFRSKDN